MVGSKSVHIPFIRQVSLIADQNDNHVIPSFRAYIVDPLRRREEGLSILAGAKLGRATNTISSDSLVMSNTTIATEQSRMYDGIRDR